MKNNYVRKYLFIGILLLLFMGISSACSHASQSGSQEENTTQEEMPQRKTMLWQKGMPLSQEASQTWEAFVDSGEGNLELLFQEEETREEYRCVIDHTGEGYRVIWQEEEEKFQESYSKLASCTIPGAKEKTLWLLCDEELDWERVYRNIWLSPKKRAVSFHLLFWTGEAEDCPEISIKDLSPKDRLEARILTGLDELPVTWGIEDEKLLSEREDEEILVVDKEGNTSGSYDIGSRFYQAVQRKEPCRLPFVIYPTLQMDGAVCKLFYVFYDGNHFYHWIGDWNQEAAWHNEGEHPYSALTRMHADWSGDSYKGTVWTIAEEVGLTYGDMKEIHDGVLDIPQRGEILFILKDNTQMSEPDGKEICRRKEKLDQTMSAAAGDLDLMMSAEKAEIIEIAAKLRRDYNSEGDFYIGNSQLFSYTDDFVRFVVGAYLENPDVGVVLEKETFYERCQMLKELFLWLTEHTGEASDLENEIYSVEDLSDPESPLCQTISSYARPLFAEWMLPETED